MVDFILVVHKMLVSLQPAYYDNEWVNPWFQKTVRQDNRIHFSFMIFWIPWWRPQRLLLSSCEMYLPKSSTIVNVSILLVIPDCKLINSVRIEFYIDHSAGQEPFKIGRDFCSLQHLEFVFRFMSVLHEQTWEVCTALFSLCLHWILPSKSLLPDCINCPPLLYADTVSGTDASILYNNTK